MSDYGKLVKRHNGRVVMSILKSFKHPVTLNDLVNKVIEMIKLDECKIKEVVKKVLARGVNYGFIKRTVDNKYIVDHPNVIGLNQKQTSICTRQRKRICQKYLRNRRKCTRRRKRICQKYLRNCRRC